MTASLPAGSKTARLSPQISPPPSIASFTPASAQTLTTTASTPASAPVPTLTSTLTPPPTLSDTASPQFTLSDVLASAERLLAEERKMRVLILSSDTGGGHKASATALQTAIEALYPADVHVDIEDFWVNLAKGPFANFPQQYTFLAKHPWMWKLTYDVTRFPPGRALTEALFNTFGHYNVRSFLDHYQPDLIVSVHPLVNTLTHRILKRIRKETGLPSVPYVTVVTDLGGAHPTWFHKNTDMTYIPIDAVRRTARRVGVADNRLRVFGLPVRSDFWYPAPEKSAIRAKLQLHTDLPALLVIGGGDGVGGLQTIAATLAETLPNLLGHSRVQLIVICGKNKEAKHALSSQQWPVPVHALGYVSNMSAWMAASDILCTKAGPGTIAEGLIRGLPIVVTGFLPGQEEANVKFVMDQGVGKFASKPLEIASIVSSWLANPELLSDMSARAQRCGRPRATVDIADDIIRVAKEKITRNLEIIESRNRPREIRTRDGLRQYLSVPMPPPEESTESHVLFRIRYLLRVVLSTMIAHDALRYDSTPLMLQGSPDSQTSSSTE